MTERPGGQAATAKQAATMRAHAGDTACPSCHRRLAIMDYQDDDPGPRCRYCSYRPDRDDHGTKVGDRIELVACDDPHTRLEPGTQGIVRYIDDAGTIHVSWDTGSTLGLIPGVDRWKVIGVDPDADEAANTAGQEQAEDLQAALETLRDAIEREPEPFHAFMARFRRQWYGLDTPAPAERTTNQNVFEAQRLLREIASLETDKGGKGYALGMVERVRREPELADDRYLQQLTEGVARMRARTATDRSTP